MLRLFADKYPIVYYKQICTDTLTQVRLICKILEINYAPTLIDKFYNFYYCTEDNRLKQPSKGEKLTKIKLLSSNTEFESYITASFDKNYRRADKLLDYE